MDSGYYAAMTGLIARTQALDTAAANLANAQTPGYRAEREYFRSVLVGPDARIPNWAAVNVTAFWRGPAQHGAGPDAADRESHSTWPSRDRDFSRSGPRTGVRYTRDGSFHRSQAGSW